MTDTAESVQFMQQHIALDYVLRVSPIAARFAGGLERGVILGRRCPSCSRVFVPPRTFCAMCTVPMGEDQELEITDRGMVTAFTILTPIQYHGQQEREEYALASILLDGADGTVGQQRLTHVALDKLRMGMRVEAVWSDDRDTANLGYGFGNAIAGWRPIDEPDVPEADFAEHVL